MGQEAVGVLPADERRLPHLLQNLLQLGKALLSQDLTPLVLHVDEKLLEQCPGSMAPIGEPNHAGTTPSGCILSLNVSQAFEAQQQLVHCLLAHARPFCQDAGAGPFGTGMRQYCHMRKTQVVEVGPIQLVDQAVLDRPRRIAEERANQHRVRRPAKFGG